MRILKFLIPMVCRDRKIFQTIVFLHQKTFSWCNFKNTTVIIFLNITLSYLILRYGPGLLFPMPDLSTHESQTCYDDFQYSPENFYTSWIKLFSSRSKECAEVLDLTPKETHLLKSGMFISHRTRDKPIAQF